jgi:hypothetical protein
MKRPVAIATLLLAAASGLPLAAPAPAIAAPAGLDPHSVAITIEDVSPSAPSPSPADKPRSIAITLTLHNTTAVDLTDVTIRADRGAPIASEADLDKAIAKPSEPDPTSVSPVRRDPVTTGTLVAGGTEGPLVYHTTTSTGTDTGICLCHDAAIYPLYFTVTATDPSTDAATTVGTAQTYLPAFGRTTPPAPLQVTWLWPLLDRPHRLTSTGYFLDDDLAAEVAVGGRLDRALRVVEDVAAEVPLTLVVDPDLLDELEVMATVRYRVATPSPKLGSIPGTGTAAARAWLDRFTAVIDTHPGIDVDLTPYADPDVESLARNGLSWTPSIADQDAQDRLASALGTRVPLHNVTWPVGHTLSQSTLTALVRQGRSTVVVGDTTLPRHRDDLGVNALAPLSTSAGPAIAAVTSGILEHDVSAVLGPSGRGLNALPELVAHLAIRVVTSPDTSHYVVLTPPRRLDVDPQVAERALRASTQAFWNQGMTLGTATRIVPGTDHGLLHPDPSVPHLPDQAIAAMQTVDRTLPGLTGKSGLPDRTAPTAATSTAVATIDRIPLGLQRTASSDLLTNPKLIVTHATGLARTVNRFRAAVHLVPPAGNASYTLTSNEAPLPVTVANPLDVAAQVRVQVRAADNRPGFRTETVTVDVPAGSTQQVRVPTRIDFTGRINVVVTLSTLNGMSVGGGRLPLSVRNTALGKVGVAITTIAAIVLAIALLFRGIRGLRWRMRRNASGPAPPVTDPLAP